MLAAEGLGMLRLTRITNLASVLLAAFSVAVHLPPRSLSARADEPPADSEVTDDFQRLPTDRAMLRELDRLREAIESPDPETFRSSLRVLRAADPGLMTQSTSGFQPLHRTLTLLLGELPPSLRQLVTVTISPPALNSSEHCLTPTRSNF
jgi:hypothetical protein